MKALMVLMLLGCFIGNMAFAEETSTICPAMRESNDRAIKNVSSVKSKPASSKGKGSLQ